MTKWLLRQKLVSNLVFKATFILQKKKKTYNSISVCLVAVWIIGDSYVHRGQDFASGTIGKNLELSNAIVSWFGQDGLRWKGLVPFFHQCLKGSPSPDVLLIHCGGDDLGEEKSINLVSAMKEDLQGLRQKHTTMKIIFSELTQRCRWSAVTTPGKLEKSRKFINNVMSAFMLSGGFVRHPLIKHNSPGLFLPDGVHLTPKGNDMFLTTLAKYIKEVLD